MKTLFFGTPLLAVPYLSLLARETELQGVVTTPDEPAGRGYEFKPSPVKLTAKELNVPVWQPFDLNEAHFIAELTATAPELVIVVAYGKILPPAVLKIPKLGYINVHFSLLPAYRGAAPIQRALMNGEQQTGVTLFWLDEGMDTGPIFLQKSLPVSEEDDAETLREKLVPLGVEALKEVLSKVSRGDLLRQSQTGRHSLAHSLKKEEGQIDWNKPARDIVNLIRGTNPWPGAFTFVSAGGSPQRLKVLKARPGTAPSGTPGSTEKGEVVQLDKGVGFVVKCGSEFLQVLQVQPEGKRPMSAWDFWQGARLKLGDKLG